MTDRITLPRATVQQALEALESGPDVDPIFAGETETALRAALEQPARAQKMRDAAYTRRPTLREMAEPVQEPGDPTYKLIGCVQHDCDECQRTTQRPAEPEQEPVAVKQHDPDIHMVGPNDGGRVWIEELSPIPVGTKLYAAPPRR